LNKGTFVTAPDSAPAAPEPPLFAATTRNLLIAAALFLLAYVAPLGVRPLFMPDESRYGEIAREMAENDGWLRLRLVGLDYYEKPPLGHWLNAASLSVFGRNPFALRLPSALAAETPAESSAKKRFSCGVFGLNVSFGHVSVVTSSSFKGETDPLPLTTI